MKKIWTLFFLLIISVSVFAEGISGLFGIEFGTESKDVKVIMKDKGWKLSKSDDTTLTYTKNKGTYANLAVTDIKFYFFDDKFYEVTISLPAVTKIDDIVSAVKAIQEAFSLTCVGNEENKLDSYTVLSTFSYIDSELNTFRLNLLTYKSVSSGWFELINYEIQKEKKQADDKIKEEENAKKNKIITSDL